MTRRISAALLLLAASGAVLAQRVPALAMVTDVQGSVSILRGTVTVPPTVAAEIAPPMRIDLKDGARLVLLEIASGDELQLSGPMTADVKAGSIEAMPRERLSRKATRVGPVKIREGGLAQAAHTMRALPQVQRLPLLSLSGTATIEAQPTFRWAPVAGAGPYRFELTDDKGAVLLEVRTEQTQLTLPPAVRLEEGRQYTWEISARRADGARYSNFGDFTVAQGLRRDRALALQPGAGASASEQATYAMWLDGQGLADAARGAWRKLSSQRPNDAMLKALAGP